MLFMAFFFLQVSNSYLTLIKFIWLMMHTFFFSIVLNFEHKLILALVVTYVLFSIPLYYHWGVFWLHVLFHICLLN